MPLQEICEIRPQIIGQSDRGFDSENCDLRSQGRQQFPRAQGRRGRQRLLGDESQCRGGFRRGVGSKLI